MVFFVWRKCRERWREMEMFDVHSIYIYEIIAISGRFGYIAIKLFNEKSSIIRFIYF